MAAPTPQEAGQKAYDAAIAGGEEQVAVFLKKQFQNLSVLYKDLEVPAADNEAEYRRMAKELIDTQKFTASKKGGGTLEISLDDLDAKDTQFELGIKRSRGVGSLREAVPTREQLQATANAVADGVQENTGTIGLLGGATFMDALAGFIKWVVGLFTGESQFSFDSIKQSIASVSAESMRDSVGGRLTQLRASRPDMAHILTDDAIAGISNEVRHTVLTEAGFAPPDAQPKVALKDVPFDSPDDNRLAETRIKIRNEILYPANGKALADTIADQMIENKRSGFWSDWFGGLVGVTENGLKESAAKIAPVIANTVANTVTNPDFRDAQGRKLSELTKDEYAAVVSEEVGKALLAHEKEFGLPKALSAKAGDKENPEKTNLDTFTDAIRDKLAEQQNYDKLALATRLAEQIGNPQAFTAAMGAVDPKAQGLHGQQHEGDVPAPVIAINDALRAGGRDEQTGLGPRNGRGG